MATTFTSYAHLQGTTTLALEVDEDVLKVLKFMQRNMQTSKFVAVSEQVAHLAPLLWSRHSREEIHPVCIKQDALRSTDD